MIKTKAKLPKRGQHELMSARGYLAVSTVARLCGVTRAAVGLWLEQGHVASTRVGLRIYVQRKSLESFLGSEGAKMLDQP